jgi:hypothetical protein
VHLEGYTCSTRTLILFLITQLLTCNDTSKLFENFLSVEDIKNTVNNIHYKPSTYNYLMLHGEMKEIKVLQLAYLYCVICVSKEEMDSTGHMLQLRLALFDGTDSIPSTPHLSN